MITLYDYYRSSASYRVRIVLNLKRLPYDQRSVDLKEGAQKADAYKATNVQGFVPTLIDGETKLTQSLAIIHYLEDRYPAPPLLPDEPRRRAEIRAMAQVVACDIHPLNNLRVLKYLKSTLGHGQNAINDWYAHWVHEGFIALETLLDEGGPYACGSEVTLVDACLVPQVYNAERFEVDLSAYPRIQAVNAACLDLAEFDRARPENQPDAPQAS
ncbi:MAG: maleylacetoacetate isomerase [Pseudomonadota bacterium]